MKYLTRFNKLSDYIGNIDNLEYPSTSYIDEDETVRYGLPSELTDKVKAIWIPYGKSNEDEDRDIIYDLSGNGNNLELTGFQWTKDSGYSDYSVDFTKWTAKYGFSTRTKNKFTITNGEALTDAGYFLWDRNAKSGFKVKITNIPNNGWMSYRYRVEDNEELQSLFIRNDGIYQLPSTLAGDDVSFFISQVSAPANDWVGLTIEQIPNNEHALITSGSSDELISSKDPISKITGNSNTITVLSVVENLDEKEIFVNFIGGDLHGSNIRNSLLTDSGICVSGYSGTSEDENPTLINTILGDKSKIKFIDKYRLTENNKILINKGAGGVGDYKLSWYGTIIAAGELSEYEMCTLLGYYILDRLIKPDVYYNIEKQGITNENHSKFNDKLIDFSGYGRSLTLSNFAWEGNSGIGNYPVVFGANKTWRNKAPEGPNSYICTINANKYNITQILLSNAWSYSYIKENGELTNYNKDVESFKIKVTGIKSEIPIRYSYLSSTDATVTSSIIIKSDGIYKLPKSFANDGSLIDNYGWIGFSFTRISADIPNIITDVDVTIEIIPSNKNAICFDGVDDRGRVDGLPTLTDYTVVSTREWIRTTGYTDGAALASKRNNQTTGGGTGDFITEVVSSLGSVHSYSYGGENNISSYFNPNKSTIYQTKYSYNGSIDLTVRTQSPTDTLLLGERGPGFGFANIAIYNFLLYPYSLNSYLIDRQLKKLKLGSLNFNSVVWYPIVNSPILIDSIEYIHIKGNEITQIEQNKLYNYEDSTLKIIINTYDQFNISSVLVNGVECSSDIPGTYTTPFPTTSPQSISIITNNDSFVLDASNRWDSNGIWKSTGIFRY